MEKSVLRKEMKRLRREMTAEERKIRDEKIFENLTTLSRFKDKKWFYIYVSYGTETDTKEIIKSSTLKVTFSTKEEIKEVDLIPVGNKSIIKIFIPEELRKNILKEKIKINYEIKENTNEIKFLDVSKLSNPMPNIEVKDGEIFVNIEEENTIGSDITLLKGYVILYDNNKIVGTTDFEISDIKNNSKFNIDVKLPSTLVINDNEESLLEYDKIEIYYTFAY